MRSRPRCFDLTTGPRAVRPPVSGGVHFLETLKLYINDINGMVKDTVIYMNKPDYDIGYILSNYLEYWENLNMIIQFGVNGNKTEKIVKENRQKNL